MAFWQSLFSRHSDDKEPRLLFGRFSDAYKNRAQLDAWDRSLKLFEERSYLPAYQAFFEYLFNPGEDNVEVSAEQAGLLRFTLYQGSKTIRGICTPSLVKAWSRIAHAHELKVGLMRRLLEENFNLTYCRYALDHENHIVCLFDSFTTDGSPFKLYYALKELATVSDKNDDLLLAEFNSLGAVEDGKSIPIPDLEKQVKAAYFDKSIREVFQTIDEGKLNPDQNPGGLSYLFLDLIYRLDYLTRPEGKTMESLEKVHNLFFATEERVAMKNHLIRKELQVLLEGEPGTPPSREFYQAPFTFGITTPVTMEKINELIDGELSNMDWYVANRHERYALAIPGYIIGFCLFNYAPPKPIRDFFHLYYQVLESEFFAALGFRLPYRDGANFQKKEIRKAIEQIAELHRPQYANLDPDTRLLQTDSPAAFARTYLLMLRKLDCTLTAS